MTYSKKIIHGATIAIGLLLFNGLFFLSVSAQDESDIFFNEGSGVGSDSSFNGPGSFNAGTGEPSGEVTNGSSLDGPGSFEAGSVAPGNPNANANPNTVGGDPPNPNTIGPGGTGKLTNPISCSPGAQAKGQCIPEFLFKIIDILLVFVLPIIIIFIMYAGFLFVTANGNTEQISTARSALLWAVVGGVIVLGARVILEVIQGTVAGLR